MSLLDDIGDAASAAGQGLELAAKWGWNQTAAGQAVQYQKYLNQQEQQKRAAALAAQAQQSLKDQMEAYSAGAVDAPLSTQNQAPVAPGRPTLMSGGYQPDTAGTGTNPTPTTYTMDQSRTLNVGGKQMNFPTDLQRGKTFIPTGGLAKALEASGAWDGKTPMTQEQSHAAMMATNESQMDEPFDIDTSGKFQDAQGNPAAVMIGRKTGTVKMLNMRGTQTSGSPGAAPFGPFDTSAQDTGPRMFDQTGQNLPQSQQSAPPQSTASNGGVRFSPAQKAEKPDASQIVPGMVGPNGGPLIYDKTTQSMKEIPPVAGSKQTMTAAQTEADKDRHVTQARLAEDTATRLSTADQAKADKAAKAQGVVQQKHDDFRSQEKDQWNLKGFYDKLIDPSQTPDNATVTLPSYNARTGEINEGQTRVMNPDLRGSLTRLSKQAADKAMENQDSARKIRKSMGWGEFAKPDQTGTDTPAQQPAQRTAAQPAPAAKAAPAGVTEGTIIVNKQTRQRQMWKGGKWAPAPSAP